MQNVIAAYKSRQYHSIVSLLWLVKSDPPVVAVATIQHF